MIRQRRSPHAARSSGETTLLGVSLPAVQGVDTTMNPDLSPKVTPVSSRDWGIVLLLAVVAAGVAALLLGNSLTLAAFAYGLAMACLAVAFYRLRRSAITLAAAQAQTQAILDMAADGILTVD